MIVVSDTSPISNLFIIGRLPILNQLYDRIIIPQAVFDELMKLEDYGFAIGKELNKKWMEIHEPKNKKEVRDLRKTLGSGESEAIVLAREFHADLLLIDERSGTLIAKSVGLYTIGLLGVLVKAKEEKIIEHLKPIMDDLEKKAGFWMSEKLKKEVLESVKE